MNRDRFAIGVVVSTALGAIFAGSLFDYYIPGDSKPVAVYLGGWIGGILYILHASKRLE